MKHRGTISMAAVGLVALAGCASSTPGVSPSGAGSTSTPQEASVGNSPGEFLSAAPVEESSNTALTIAEEWDRFDSSQKEWVCEHTDVIERVNEFATWAEDDHGVTEVRDFLMTACEEIKPTRVVTSVKKSAHEDISSRDWKKITKDPDSHEGENIILFALVTQADENTGTNAFRGDASTYDDRSYGSWDWDGTNTMFYGDESDLEDVVVDDIVKAWVTILGGLSYDTQSGGTANAVEVQVNHIEVIGQN